MDICCKCESKPSVRHCFVGKRFLPLCPSCELAWLEYNRRNPKYKQAEEYVLEEENKIARARRDMMVMEFQTAGEWLGEAVVVQ